MEIGYDPAKNERNIRDRGLSFESAAEFDFETALILIDDRRSYGEPRMRAVGFIGARVHVLVFTLRGDTLRVIGLRRANQREVRLYEEQTRP